MFNPDPDSKIFIPDSKTFVYTGFYIKSGMKNKNHLSSCSLLSQKQVRKKFPLNPDSGSRGKNYQYRISDPDPQL
jgi:hypothetical protein